MLISHKKTRYISTLSWIGICVLLIFSNIGVYAQKSSYLQLTQSTQPKGFDIDFDWFYVSSDSALLNVFVQIPLQQLAFQRENIMSNEELLDSESLRNNYKYKTTYAINLEIYKGDYEDQNIRELVQRLFIADTVMVDTYEQTLDPHLKSRHLSSIPLDVGTYTIHITYQSIKGLVSLTGVTPKEGKDSGFDFRSNNRKKRSDTHLSKSYYTASSLQEVGVLLKPSTKAGLIPIYFLEHAEYEDYQYLSQQDNDLSYFTWIGSTNRVSYGSTASIAIPYYSISQLNYLNYDIYDATLDSILWNNKITLTSHPFYSLMEYSKQSEISSDGLDALEIDFLIIEIPTEKLNNSTYQLRVITGAEANTPQIIEFHTYWKDMPTSLYQIDVAIDMLRFIIGDETVDPVLKLSSKEKLAFFNDFWNPKDPIATTPENELMTEYYRRIDYAYNTFSTTSEPEGYQSDQGQLYIKMGPPLDIERSFPTNGNVRETWTYPNGEYIFTASSGFGDFKLISTPQKPSN
ncbi:MAG: GWxTD domain-containing protein [Bacteroidetes bacterium]|nr:GWxTD domain-containing protein [Bacteroidota bacterium]